MVIERECTPKLQSIIFCKMTICRMVYLQTSMTEFIRKCVHMLGHDGMMVFDEDQNTCRKSVVTYFTKNSKNDFEHFYQNH